MTSLRYLIAGGAGFIGSHLVDRLLSHDAEVIVLDNFSSGSKRNLELLNDNPHLKVFNIDITKNLPELHDFDAIFHLAAIANPTDYEMHPIETLLVNSEGNKNLIELARQSNSRYYFFSSAEIYGHHKPISKGGIIEDNMSYIVLNQKRSPYYIGKIYGEEFVRVLCSEFNLEYIIVRPFNIYGPRMDLKTSYGRVIPNFIKWALLGQPLAINGDGTQERSFCYIDDFIECIMKTLEKKSIDYDTINIGNPEPIKIFTLAQKINEITGNQSGYVSRKRYKYEPKYRTPNIERAKKWLAWEPKVKLEEGILAIINKDRNLSVENYGLEGISCCSNL